MTYVWAAHQHWPAAVPPRAECFAVHRFDDQVSNSLADRIEQYLDHALHTLSRHRAVTPIVNWSLTMRDRPLR